MADETELRMNLAAIKRVDPYATDIIDSSAHVAFYTFNPEETEWEKTDVEGAFFVYSRNAEPLHSIFINNRLNTNSLVEPITGQIELQSQPPFLLYRNERSRIRGFWFYNRTECDRIGELVERIVRDCPSALNKSKSGTALNSSTHVPSKPIDMIRQSNSSVDIFSMLSKAQQDFNNALTAPTAVKTTLTNSSAAVAAVISNGGGSGSATEKSFRPPHASAVPIPNRSSGTSESVMNFFAAAKPSKPKEVPFLQRMLSAPVHVDQIEKQQRVTPHNDKHSSPQQAVISDNGHGFMRIHSPSQQPGGADFGTSPLASFINANNLSKNAKPNVMDKVSNVQDIETEKNRPLSELLKRPTPLTSNAAPNSSNVVQAKPALMLPTMFKSTLNTSAGSNTSSSSRTTNNTSSGSAPKPKGPPAPTNNAPVYSIADYRIQNAKQSTPIANKSVKEGSNAVEPATVSKPEPLTQTQLLQAMSYLIKNDPEFVRKLHEAYLKSFTEMVSL